MGQPASKRSAAELHAARLARDPAYRAKIREAEKVMAEERGQVDDVGLLEERLDALRSE